MKSTTTLTLLVLSLIVMFSQTPPALAGHATGNGGDIASQEFTKIGDDLYHWLSASPQILAKYKIDIELFLKQVETTQVESSNVPLLLNGVPKDAINYPDEHRIVIDRKTWEKMTTYRQKAGLVLHEYLAFVFSEDLWTYKVSQAVLDAARFGMKIGVEGSTAYEQFIINNDGSVTVVRPYYLVEGKAIPLYGIRGGVAGDQNGLCRRYALGDLVDYTVIDIPKGPSAIIGNMGELLDTRDTDERCDPKTYRGGECTNTVIQTISCAARSHVFFQDVPSVEERSETVVYGDNGLVTIVNPYVLGMDQKKIPILFSYPNYTESSGAVVLDKYEARALSEHQGICRYFGFYDFVSGVDRDITSEEAQSRLEANVARIDPDGTLAGFEFGGRGTSVVQSITCRN